MCSLTEEMMAQEPATLFSFWDAASLSDLGRYKLLFDGASKANAIGRSEHFYTNWGNCLKALRFKQNKAEEYYRRNRPQLSENEMLSPPESMYVVWDVCEIDQLLRYRAQFKALEHKYSHDLHFATNFANCDAAVRYIQDSLANDYFSRDLGEPLKKAVRNGRAVYMNGSLENNRQKRMNLLAIPWQQRFEEWQRERILHAAEHKSEVELKQDEITGLEQRSTSDEALAAAIATLQSANLLRPVQTYSLQEHLDPPLSYYDARAGETMASMQVPHELFYCSAESSAPLNLL